MIIPYWKVVGPTTHQIAQKFSRETGEKCTHTGSLDPLAEGVIVLLTGKDRFLKEELSHGNKHYQVQILVGISTTTHDLLGAITRLNSKTHNLSLSHLKATLNYFWGTIYQKPPLYSARRVKGKPLFVHAQQGTITLDEVPYFKRQVLSIQLQGHSTICKSHLYSSLHQRISRVSQNFQPEKFLAHWQGRKPSLPNKLPLIKLNLITSRGTYVRSLVRDLAQKTNIPLVIYSLTRTQNGPFTRASCINISASTNPSKIVTSEVTQNILENQHPQGDPQNISTNYCRNQHP